ncbi:MAG: hypothetical protein MRZ54_03990 [Clostridiales bacterium]|nr:hypothetical protein [Clostridiales bacterium]
MKKSMVGFLVIALCLGMLAGSGAVAANAPSDVLATSNPTSSGDGASVLASAFSDEELQMLRALQFHDYRHMTIAEFQNKVWEMTDTPEYSELLSRFSKDEALYALRDSDETAAFIYYVLVPLTKEKWQSHTYCGAASSDFPTGQDNARLEYTYTLTILAADKVKVKDYCDTCVNVRDAMNSMMLDRMQEQLQSEEYMLAELKTFVDGILPHFQTPELTVAIEYAYFPLSAAEEDGAVPEDKAAHRTTPHGTESDYRSLLALKTPDYREMSLADFNAALFHWADEDHERMERIDEDGRWDDCQVPLSEDERSFVELTVFLSGMENGQAVRSAYTGKTENDPWHYQQLPPRFGASGGRSGYCALYYHFSWHIADKEAITVGERDRQISGMMKAVQDFWNETDTEELLKMAEVDIVAKLQEIAAEYSTSNITLTTSEDHVQFENIK